MLKQWELSREELYIPLVHHPPSQNTQPVKSSINYSFFSSVCVDTRYGVYLYCSKWWEIYRGRKIQFNRKTKGSSFYGRSTIQLQELMSFVQQNTSLLPLAMKGQLFLQLNINAATCAKGLLSVTINHILLSFSNTWDSFGEMISLCVKTARRT